MEEGEWETVNQWNRISETDKKNVALVEEELMALNLQGQNCE